MNIQTAIGEDLWGAVRRSYESQAWANAILDAIHHLSDAIRLKTGLQSDGTALAGQALGGKSPKLRLNRLQTESDQSIQAGVEQLLRGLYQAVRNPRSHGRLDDSQGDADTLILFVDYLLRVLGHARASFSLENCVSKIIEENFVPSERYAALLLEKIPSRHRLEVALAVYQRKGQAEGKRLRYFFQAIIVALSSDERQEFFGAVSEDLRETSDEVSLKYVLQIIDPDQWPTLSEVARLRSEHRIIRNLRDGRHQRSTNRCLGGSLATWSTAFWKYFTLKIEMVDVLIEKLGSWSMESQDYALVYMFDHIESLMESPPHRLQAVIAARLKAGDIRFKEAVDSPWSFQDSFWSDAVLKASAQFVPAEQPNPEEDNDIPS
jgi:uncharacterized protein (TIGR02391 family)